VVYCFNPWRDGIVKKLIILLLLFPSLCFGGGVAFKGTALNRSFVAENSITLGTLYIATKDGEAMFFHDSLDFSGYTGNYRLTFIDSAGKKAEAYAGAVGGGETLGVEELVNGDCEASPITGWIEQNSAIINRIADPRDGSSGSYSIEITRGPAGNNALFQQPSVNGAVGRLFKIDFWGKVITSNYAYSLFSGTPRPMITDTSWTRITDYGTQEEVSLSVNGVFRILLYTLEEETRIDDASLKMLTDVPSTGLRLVSANGGATRNMASVETDFNPNAINKVQIWRE
jgi:hypothetical protein